MRGLRRGIGLRSLLRRRYLFGGGLGWRGLLGQLLEVLRRSLGLRAHGFLHGRLGRFGGFGRPAILQGLQGRELLRRQRLGQSRLGLVRPALLGTGFAGLGSLDGLLPNLVLCCRKVLVLFFLIIDVRLLEGVLFCECLLRRCRALCGFGLREGRVPGFLFLMGLQRIGMGLRLLVSSPLYRGSVVVRAEIRIDGGCGHRLIERVATLGPDRIHDAGLRRLHDAVRGFLHSLRDPGQRISPGPHIGDARVHGLRAGADDMAFDHGDADLA